MRRHAVRHLNREDAERPDVRLGGVRLPHDDLRRHEQRGAARRFPLLQRVVELRRHAEVPDLALPAIRQHDVARFQVAVDDFVRVQVAAYMCACDARVCA